MKGISIKHCAVYLLFASLMCPILLGGVDPEAKALFDRYADAIGGVEAFDEIDSARMEMTMEIPSQNMVMKMNVLFSAPDKIYMEAEIPGMGSMRQGFDGEKGWSIDLIQGLRELKGMELEKLRSDSDFKEGVRLEEKYVSASVTGVEEKGFVAVKAVKVSDGNEETLYFEKDSGLLRKTTAMESMGPQGEIPMTTRMPLYEAYGDLLLPTLLDVEMMGMGMEMRIESFEPNVDVDPSVFKMPE
ncbi:MAG: hypothetical protein HOL92_19430 [Opitutales bacterium]|nr:hypothetical protein [Opitutales bacterium]